MKSVVASRENIIIMSSRTQLHLLPIGLTSFVESFNILEGHCLNSSFLGGIFQLHYLLTQSLIPVLMAVYSSGDHD